MVRKVLFWLGSEFTHFCLSHYLQKIIDDEFYAIIDITNKPKSFFEDQKLVNFQKKWFFHDHINLNFKKPNLEYLSKIENEYGVNIWKLALNERIFSNSFNFHKFTRDEILSIDEQSCRLFEEVLNEVKPDYFITKQTAFHHLQLFYEMCRARGVKVLMLNNSNFGTTSIIVEDIRKLDGSPKLDDFSADNRTLEDFQSYLRDLKTNIDTNIIREPNSADFLKSVIKFSTSDNKNTKTNYNYFGRTKFNVFSFTMKYKINTNKRKKFIDSNLTLSPNIKEKFIYFPLSLDMERSTLIDAPYYTNQIEVVRSIAKSIPIDHTLFVKEHPGQFLRGWRKISEYQEILDIPNVTFVHPDYPSEKLYQHSSLIMTIGGTTGFEAAIHGKPSIIFNDLRYSLLPSVTRLKSIDDLPNIINQCINKKVNPDDVNKFIQLMESVTIDFNWQSFTAKFDDYFYYGGSLFDVEISESDMTIFLKNNKNVLEKLASNHVKKMNELEKK